MPPKQKRKAPAVAKVAKKPKKLKIVDKDQTVVDSGFQNINHDIAKKILDNLQLSVFDLEALSVTCSSWHVKISTYLRQIWAHILPFSHQYLCKEEKYETMEAIGQTRQFISDIQILEFNEIIPRFVFMDFPMPNHTQTVSIPWCPYLVIVGTRDGASILDLRKSKPIVPCPKELNNLEDAKSVVTFNTHRKQLLISKTLAKNGDKKQVYTNILCIYDVSDDGKVDLVKQIETKYEDFPHPPRTTIIGDDGSIWVAWKSKVEIHNNSQIEIYNYPGKLGNLDREPKSQVVGFIEHQGTMKIILHRYAGIEDIEDDDDFFDPVTLTLLYDTKTRHYVELPIRMTYDGYHKYQYVNDSLQLTTQGNFIASCNLEPIQREFEGDEYDEFSGRYFAFNNQFTLSPDGSRLLEYNPKSLTMPISFKHKADTRTNNQQDYNTAVQSKVLFFDPNHKTNQKSADVRKGEDKIDRPLLSFLWLSNDIVVGIYGNRIAVLDFRYAVPEGGFQSFEVPMIDNVYWYRFARLTETSFVVVSANPNVVAYKIAV